MCSLGGALTPWTLESPRLDPDPGLVLFSCGAMGISLFFRDLNFFTYKMGRMNSVFLIV